MKLLEGSSMIELARFANIDDAAANVYVFDLETRDAFHPDACGGIPWPVLLTFGMYSKKHIFAGNKNPCVVAAAKQVKAFCDKIRWSDVLKESEEQNPLLRKLRKARASTPHCSRIGSPEIAAMTRLIYRKTMDQIRKVAQLKPGRRPSYSNIPGFVRWTLQWLKHSHYKVVPTDKDGIVALIEKESLATLFAEKLRPPFYLPLDKEVLDRQHVATLVSAYCKLCSRLGKTTGLPRLANVLRQDIGEGGACFALNCQLKTHKPRGKVGLRILHSSAGHKFHPLSKFLGLVTSDSLKGLAHICSSRSAFFDES